MRHFVGHHLGHPLAGAGRRVFRVHQQRRFAVGDAAPIFHRPGGEVGDGDMVQLGQGIGNAEVIVEIPQQLDRSIQRESGLRFLARRSPDAHPRAVGGISLHRHQIAHHKGQQVGGHHRRLGESDRLPSRRGRRFRHDGRIGNRLVAVGEHQSDVEHRLKRRLIPAGKGAAGIGSLKLRSSQIADFPVRRPVFGAVKPHQPVIQHAGKRQIQLRRPRRQNPPEIQRNGFGIGIQRHRMNPHRRPPVAPQGHGADLQLRRIQRNAGGRLQNLHIHGLPPRESKGIQIRLQRKPVPPRQNIPGQHHSIGGRHKAKPLALLWRKPSGGNAPGGILTRIAGMGGGLRKPASD